RFFVPLRRHLLRLRPELDRAAAGDVADAELRFVPAAEAEWLAWHGDADVHADHSRAGVLHHVTRDAAALGEYARRVAVARTLLHIERFVDVLRANDHHHRSEYFLLCDLHVGRDVVDERRSDVVSVLASAHDRTASVDENLRAALLDRKSTL